MSPLDKETNTMNEDEDDDDDNNNDGDDDDDSVHFLVYVLRF
jgi:hypothetical protein